MEIWAVTNVKRAVIAAIVGQFGHPQGMAGRVAGRVMARRPSNRQRNRWVVSLLDVQPTDRVLEIGFGPGLAIAELARRIGDAGHVDGIDHSEVMLRQATRRNAAAIASQPRCPGAMANTSHYAAREIQALLHDAGYTQIRTQTLDLDPPVVCILAPTRTPVQEPVGDGQYLAADVPGQRRRAQSITPRRGRVPAAAPPRVRPPAKRQ